jgi:hypothetical protein
MTDLLSELRRSPVAGDREVAELLRSLRPADGSRPRASETLAAFIVERAAGVTPSAELREPAKGSSLLVVLGSAPEPRLARRRRVLTGVWAQAAAAGAIALVAVAIAAGGPSRDVVVRPTDSSSTVAPAATTPADQADPTPRRHHRVVPSVGSRPHRARTHSAATATTRSDLTPAARTSAATTGEDESARETEDTVQEPGVDHGDETASGTDDGGSESSDGGGGDGGETPDGVDD